MREISEVAVLGAGTMGAGIAQVVARAGLIARVYDSAAGATERATGRLTADLERLVARGKLSPLDRDGTLERWRPAQTLSDLASSDLVIEAAPESLEMKREIFQDLDTACPDAILATNTSTLSVSAIASAVQDPGRVVGLHFFNPAPVMALVEVIAGDLTRPDVLATAETLVRRLGKTPVLATDTPGFVVNRVARPFYGEGLRLLAEGTPIETVDRVLRGAGFRMGPFELMDLIGLDVNLAASRSVYEAFFHDPRYRPHPIQQKMVDSGRLGRKSGRGFYTHAPPTSDATPTSEAIA